MKLLIVVVSVALAGDRDTRPNAPGNRPTETLTNWD